MQRLFLVGPMGAGKTTLGKLVAAELGFDFVDSDQVIEQRTGVDIPTIFDFEGEAGFREREARILDELTRRDRIVLATGGGAVLRPENREHLRARGFVVYLQVSVARQLERTARDRNRPLLQTPDPAATLRRLAEEREPLYRSVADAIIDTSHLRTRALKQRILAAWRERAQP